MKGYKVFRSDWTCRGFQYAVGGTYEMEDEPSCCKRGFHFCGRLIDCFNYYDFNSNNKVAEIEATGAIDDDGNEEKYCTNKIKIVRELSWHEVLDLVNTGKDNTGNRNTGNRNTGDWNTGNRNTGDWNSTERSTGCFNTETENIRLFNKPSDWTYQDWLNSKAWYVMTDCPHTRTIWIDSENMIDSKKEENPTWECTGGYLKTIEATDRDKQAWWDNPSDRDKESVMSLPNFDKDVFKEVTGIEV